MNDIIVEDKDLFSSNSAEIDEEGFTDIYNWLFEELYNDSYCMTRCKTTSEELVQEVFLKLWLNRSKIHEVNNLRWYIKRMGKNMAIDYLRKQKKINDGNEAFLTLNIGNHTEQHEEIEFRKLVASAVRKLPLQQRRIYILGREMGWKRRRIALALKIAPNTVNAAMQQAVKGVCREVRRCYEVEGKVKV